MSHSNKILSYFGDVYTPPPDTQENRHGVSPMEHRTTYTNNLPVPITVVWRSGLKFTISPTRSMTCRKLLIRVEIIMDANVKNDVQQMLSTVDETSSKELIALRDSLILQNNRNKYAGATLLLEHPLTLKELQDHGGTVYYDDLDCVISLESMDQVLPHPYSELGKQQQIIASSPLGETGFGYSVEMIDNAGKHGERYLNIGNKVYKVTPKKNITRRDGIYVTSNNPIEGEFGLNETIVKFYSFEGAEEKLGLYQTYENALNLGDLSLARKQELIALETQVLSQKAELQSAKHRHDMLMIEKDKETKAREAETKIKDDAHDRYVKEMQAAREKTEHDMALERQRMKDHYENKAHDRKESSESLKFIP